MTKISSFFLVTVFLFTSLLAFADDLQPLYIEIEQLAGEQQYRVRMKLPPKIDEANRPDVELPSTCKRLSIYVWRCDEAIGGEQITLKYPRFDAPNSTVVKTLLVDGESHTIALGSGERQWQMPKPEKMIGVAAQYTWLGVEHIWIGLDHLLFILCLIWIAGTWRRILVTITGFTVAHSITLVLSALNVIRLPVPPIEAVIALSVVFLATEVSKGRRNSLTWRRPVTVSSSFGLLHGLGFAAVLSEIGLPKTEVITGLLFFNIGVEVGQAAFAMAIVILIATGQKLVNDSGDKSSGASFQQRSQKWVGYLVGCTAAYWLVQRVVAFA